MKRMPVPKAQQKWGLPIRSFSTYIFDTSVGIRLNSTVLMSNFLGCRSSVVVVVVQALNVTGAQVKNILGPVYASNGIAVQVRFAERRNLLV